MTDLNKTTIQTVLIIGVALAALVGSLGGSSILIVGSPGLQSLVGGVGDDLSDQEVESRIVG